MNDIKKDINLYNYLMNKAESNQKRYIEAEKFICRLYDQPWYKAIYYRLFKLDEDILEFIKSRDKFKNQ